MNLRKIIRDVLLEQFALNPIKGEDNFYRYEDEYVNGVINIYENGVGIYEWSSKYSEKGGTEKSLKNIRNKYKGIISVHDIGNYGDDSFNYWINMKKKGLVDYVIDDFGITH